MSNFTLNLPGEPTSNVLASSVGQSAPYKEADDLGRFGNLTEEQQAQVLEFAERINIRDSKLATDYGIEAQKEISKFTDKGLQGVSGKDTGDIGDLLFEMTNAICGFNKDFREEYGDGKKKKLSIFQKAKKTAIESKERIRVQYDDVSQTLDRITAALEARKGELEADLDSLNGLYDQNLDHFVKLNMYILAGKKALDDLMTGELEELRLKAEATGLPEDAQAYNDLLADYKTFEKKIFDLELTRSICLQFAPQVRIIQQTNKDVIQQIMSAILNSIPLWQSQIVIALALENSKKANAACSAMKELTGQMLVENAKQLHMVSVDAAQQSEEGFIKVDAILESNAELIKTIEETTQIYQNGRKKRDEDRKVLAQMEHDLKEALIRPSDFSRQSLLS